MTYKDKLEELRKIAVDKVKILEEIHTDLISAHIPKKYVSADHQIAINEHTIAVNDYGRLVSDMVNKGYSQSDEMAD